jgi:PAS domain S-box-containing protein
MPEQSSNSLQASPGPKRRSPLITWSIGAAVILLVAGLRLGLERTTLIPIAYGVPLLVCLWMQSRPLLWVMAAALSLIGAAYFIRLAPSQIPPGTNRLIDFIIVELDTFTIAAVFHLLIGSRIALGDRNSELEESNQSLARREEIIATQNEELQAKTEELERQGEELRVTNEELEMRERMLEQLLQLSHSLTAELTRPQLTARLCEAASALLNVPGADAAILERHGSKMQVFTCNGSGETMQTDPIPWESSLAQLVMERDQTAYIEDLARRTDLHLPQSKDDRPIRSALATPLRINGKAIGTIEVYSPSPRNWSRKEIALVEALAAQASTSLENLHLFEEAEDQRRRLETIFRTLPVGVMISDASYNDVRMNAAGAAMVGDPLETNFARADAVGGRWWLEKNGQPLQLADQPLVRALHHGEEVRGQELEIAFVDRRRITLLVAAAPITDRQQRILGAVCTFVDITPLKKLQRELEDRRREAEEASLRKTQFLAAVSHDIRTPANAINLLAELLRRSSQQPHMVAEIPQMAADLQASSMSLVNLVSDVLDVTRYDYGRIDLHDTEFDLGELLEEQLRQLRPLAEAKGLTLESPILAPATIHLRGDRTKLARVIVNLLGNAIKFTESGRVVVRALALSGLSDTPPQAGELRLTISDTGVGVPPQYLSRIFDEFFQVKNPARDRNKGAGLGLAICKRLVDAMGGRLSVQSEVGIGTTFTVSLPDSMVLADSITPTAQSDSANQPSTSHLQRLKGMKILLIEDHHATRVATSALLTSEGAIVTEATDGTTAMNLLRQAVANDGQDGIEVILLDLMLPDMDGEHILQWLHDKRPQSLHTILVLTGHVVTDRLSQILRLGIDSLIHKPIDIKALVGLLQARLPKD